MIKDKIKKWAEKYSGNPIARSAVIGLSYGVPVTIGIAIGSVTGNPDAGVSALTSGLISLAGAPISMLDSAISSWGQKFPEDRSEKLLDELDRSTRDLDIEQIDEEYLKSEEWFDLLLKAFDSANKTRSEEQIKVYARILKGAVLSKSDREKTSAEEYLHILSDLTPKEVEISYHLFDDLENKGNELWYQSICEKCSIDDEDLQFYLNRIESVGLIARDSSMRVGPVTTPYYLITGGFRKLMEFIKD